MSKRNIMQPFCRVNRSGVNHMAHIRQNRLILEPRRKKELGQHRNRAQRENGIFALIRPEEDIGRRVSQRVFCILPPEGIKAMAVAGWIEEEYRTKP